VTASLIAGDRPPGAGEGCGSVGWGRERCSAGDADHSRGRARARVARRVGFRGVGVRVDERRYALRFSTRTRVRPVFPSSGSTNVIMHCVSRPAPRVRAVFPSRGTTSVTAGHVSRLAHELTNGLDARSEPALTATSSARVVRIPRPNHGMTTTTLPKQDHATGGEGSPAGAKRFQPRDAQPRRLTRDCFTAWPAQSRRPAASRDGTW
jgi:hypothetical protein